ncbi:hypothetical protein IB289_23950 [Vibrio parahaemolyticus]|uniref:hypothetical protein n=1 Tax=Vibrio parahaemolyticus TaxID=670 RepID=UPI001D16A255|nr:hypothetical protein [Vibrio parahaemolyticus]MCC3859404.1 hypothetical protein [Vibrio parahaemolyticus]
MYSWVSEFESTFSISPLEEHAPYAFIEGECRYLQSLGSIELVVKVPHSECGLYSEFSEVAFLVNQWVKIQDSLEMLFNLLTGNSTKSLEMLSYLRKNQIPSYEFALYLSDCRKVVLVNRFTGSKSDRSTRNSQLNKIKALILRLNSPCHYLIVGDRAKTAIENLRSVLQLGVVYHTSGVVLNNYSSEYHNTWYLLDDEACKYTSANFSLRTFQRL